jgi:hypothetical protein
MRTAVKGQRHRRFHVGHAAIFGFGEDFARHSRPEHQRSSMLLYDYNTG